MSRNLKMLGVCFVLLFLTACNPAEPESSSSVTWDGREIVVRGGSSQSVSITDDGAAVKVNLNGYDVTVSKNQIDVNGNSKDIPDFQEMVVALDGKTLTVEADGQRVWP